MRNGRDNAYISFPLAGIALFQLGLPFAIAALLPYGRTRRALASAGVVLVRVIGGCWCVMFSLAVIPAATQSYTRTVLMSHLAGLALLLPVVLGIGRRLRR